MAQVATRCEVGMTGGETAGTPDATLLTAAARCWRAARDGGEPVQRRLYLLLAPRNLGLLAPVLDSLLRLCEAALGRPIGVGAGDARSADESLLHALIDGSRLRRACIRCDVGTASALDCAICSTRLMLALAVCERETRPC